MNFFKPSSKLKQKKQIKGKLKKVYDRSKTPYQRVISSNEISDKINTKLKKQFDRLNPFKLQIEMGGKIKHFLNNTTPLNEEIKRAVNNKLRLPFILRQLELGYRA